MLLPKVRLGYFNSIKVRLELKAIAEIYINNQISIP